MTSHFSMSNSTQNKLEKYIQDIIEACRTDPGRIEVAIVNFKSLLTAMKVYDNAPRYFNSILEEAEMPAIQGQPQYQQEDQHTSGKSQFPVIGEMEKIFNRKLKQVQLQQIASALSMNTGVRLDRDTRRSKIALVQWFTNNWAVLHPKIYELGLPNKEFR